MEPEGNGWGDEDLMIDDLGDLELDLDEDVFKSTVTEVEKKQKESVKNPIDNLIFGNGKGSNQA